MKRILVLVLLCMSYASMHAMQGDALEMQGDTPGQDLILVEPIKSTAQFKREAQARNGVLKPNFSYLDLNQQDTNAIRKKYAEFKKNKAKLQHEKQQSLLAKARKDYLYMGFYTGIVTSWCGILVGVGLFYAYQNLKAIWR